MRFVWYLKRAELYEAGVEDEVKTNVRKAIALARRKRYKAAVAALPPMFFTWDIDKAEPPLEWLASGRRTGNRYKYFYKGTQVALRLDPTDPRMNIGLRPWKRGLMLNITIHFTLPVKGRVDIGKINSWLMNCAEWVGWADGCWDYSWTEEFGTECLGPRK